MGLFGICTWRRQRRRCLQGAEHPDTLAAASDLAASLACQHQLRARKAWLTALQELKGCELTALTGIGELVA